MKCYNKYMEERSLTGVTSSSTPCPITVPCYFFMTLNNSMQLGAGGAAT